MNQDKITHLNIEKTETPFFSIGVPTYNRRELLKETLDSIIQQTFTNFEIIVGNSYTYENLSAEELGIYDSRVRYVNHPEDLGKNGVYNCLPALAHGRYFTWLSDDDCFHPDFLKSVFDALKKFESPCCIFTGFTRGSNFVIKKQKVSEPMLLTGPKFLREYLSKQITLVGCSGVFDMKYLTKIGGKMEVLAQRESPYSDNLIAMRSGVLKKVVYIDSPLLFMRSHDNSISWKSTDVKSYATAQKNLCIRYVEIFKNNLVKSEFQSNLFLLLEWCINDFIAVIKRSQMMHFVKIIKYMGFLKKNLMFLRGTKFYLKIIIHFTKQVIKLLRIRISQVTSLFVGNLNRIMKNITHLFYNNFKQH